MVLRHIYKSVIGILLMMPVLLSAHNGTLTSRFDTLYDRAFKSLPDDTVMALSLVRKMISMSGQLSDIQKAKLSYLQLNIHERVNAGRNSHGKLNIPSLSSIKSPDTLEFYANRYLERSMPDRAIELLMRELEILPQNSEAAHHATIGLCEAYRQKQEYSKGVGLIVNLLEQTTQLTDQNRTYAYNRLAALYNEWRVPPGSYTDSVFRYSLLCEELSRKTSDIPSLAASQNELSFQFLHKGKYKKALELSELSVSNFLSSRMPYHAMNALLNQSNIFIAIKDYHTALVALEKATSLAPIWENRNLYMRIYQQYAGIHSILGDYHEAFEFMVLCNHLQAEFFMDRIDSRIVEQSAKYDLLLKEQRIREEQKKNEFRNRQLILMFIISVTLTLALVFSLFYFRLRRKSALRQKLVDAVQETEMNERRRIARDLHDGLGPVLSAINHYFQAYLDAKPNDKEAIQNRLQQVIMEAIDEVSRISHNISPHVLEKHGLFTALNNLIAPLTSNGRYEIRFSFECPAILNPKLELTVYRCITELLNNTMKHAEATRITLHIKIHGDLLVVDYSDNGKGFETRTGKRTGMGLHNISNRVDSGGGTLSVDSSSASGTSFNITLPL